MQTKRQIYKKSRQFFLIIFFCLFVSQSFSQSTKDAKIDGLIASSKSSRLIDVDSGIVYANLALDLSKQKNDKYLIGKSSAVLASSLRIKGNNAEKVITLLEETVRLFRSINEKELLGRAYNSLALSYDDKGDYKKALDYNFQALAVFNDLSFADGIQETSNNIAVIYESLDDPKNALKYYDQSLEFAKKTNKPEAISGAYANLGGYYVSNGNYPLAVKYLKLAMDIKKSINDWAGVSRIINNMGNMYYDKGEIEKGINCFKQSLEIKKTHKIYDAINSSYFNLGYIEEDRGNFKQAVGYYQQAYDWSEKFNDLKGSLAAIGGLINVYDTLGEYKNAVKLTFQYIGLNDSLFNIEKNKQTLDLKEKYETDKKEKEILLQQERLLKAQAISDKNEEESKRKTTFMIAILGVLILVSVLLFMVFKNAKAKQRTNIELEHKNKVIEHQKEIVEEKQKEIIDSINYAKRIQTALLANDKLLDDNLPEHFVLFKPKDIVAGDFYWAASTPEGFIYITADCTGHGVPGAFMSLLNISKLNETINQKHIFRPDLIFNDVRTEIIKALNPEGSSEESKDGMDAVLCKLDIKNMKLEFTGANNGFYIVRKKELLVCNVDKMSVGKGHDEQNNLFTYNEIALEKGDMIFTFTDGYADQFGGPKGKKFKYKQMEDLMLSIVELTMNEQKEILDQRFEAWKGNLEQVDDVLVIGVRI